MIVEIGKKYTLASWLQKELLLNVREVQVIGSDSSVVYVESGKINRAIPYLVFINNAKETLGRVFRSIDAVGNPFDNGSPGDVDNPVDPSDPDANKPTDPVEPDNPVEPEPTDPYPNDPLAPGPQDNPDNPYGEDYI